MRVCPIASGSSGNCIYVGDSATHILIDAGVSCKKMVEGLKGIGIEPGDLSAIFITHEHSDHISGLRVFLKKYRIPTYATGKTVQAILRKDNTNEMEMDWFKIVKPDEKLQMQSMRIQAFRTSHDAVEPVGYTVETDGKKFGMATDLGTFDEYIISNLVNCDILLLEANHDVSMLEVGNYPYSLKRRILSDKGHLSNVVSGQLLCQLYSEKMQHVILAHLSKEHNYPELAYQTVKSQLLQTHAGNFPAAEIPFEISVAKRDVPSKMCAI